jgi:hypothetical protein
MRCAQILAVWAMMCFFGALAASAQADDFGPRFFAQAPAGLGEYTAPDTKPVQLLAAQDDMAVELQNIEPAAGTQETALAPPVEPSEKSVIK